MVGENEGGTAGESYFLCGREKISGVPRKKHRKLVIELKKKKETERPKASC